MTEINSQSSYTKKAPASALFAWSICSLGALFYCYEYLLRISPSVMSTDLMRAYQIDATAFGNLVAFYYYAYTPMQLPVGVLMDHYGPRRLLIFACVACSVGTYLFASQQSLVIAQIGRFLVGFGSAFAFVGVLKLATIWLPPHRFAFIAGLTVTLGMIGAMAGDICLVPFIKAEGWRNATLFSASVGIVLAILIGLAMPDTDRQLGKPKDSTLHDFAHLFKELFKLLKNRYIWLNGLIGCLMYLPLSAFAELWGVPYLESAFHYSRAEAASMISLVFLGWAIGGPLMGWTSDRIRCRKAPIIFGSIMMTIVFGSIIFVPNLQKNVLMALLFFLGFFGSSKVLTFAIAREISSAKLAATALAFTNMIVMLGGVILQPLIGFLLDIRWSGVIINHVHVYSETDYRFALAALPVCAAVAVLAALLMKETHAEVH